MKKKTGGEEEERLELQVEQGIQATTLLTEGGKDKSQKFCSRECSFVDDLPMICTCLTLNTTAPLEEAKAVMVEDSKGRKVEWESGRRAEALSGSPLLFRRK